MTTTVERTVDLAAPADVIWRALTASTDAFRHVTRGLLRYPPGEIAAGPLRQGASLAGCCSRSASSPSTGTPSVVAVDHDGRRLVTDEHGGVLRTWHHTMTVEARGTGASRHTDRVEIDAGALTPAVAALADLLHRIRQRRWARLAPLLRAAASGRRQAPGGRQRTSDGRTKRGTSPGGTSS